MKDEIKKHILNTKDMTYKEVNKKFGYSERTIAKYRKELGIQPPQKSKVKSPKSKVPKSKVPDTLPKSKPLVQQTDRVFTTDYLRHMYELRTGKTARKIKKNELIDWVVKQLNQSKIK